MKEEEIKIRISETLKKEFRNVCEVEKDTVSNKLHTFIVNEVNIYKTKLVEEQMSEIFEQIGIKNVTIIKGPNELIIKKNMKKTVN